MSEQTDQQMHRHGLAHLKAVALSLENTHIHAFYLAKAIPFPQQTRSTNKKQLCWAAAAWEWVITVWCGQLHSKQVLKASSIICMVTPVLTWLLAAGRRSYLIGWQKKYSQRSVSQLSWPANDLVSLDLCRPRGQDLISVGEWIREIGWGKTNDTEYNCRGMNKRKKRERGGKMKGNEDEK